MKKFGLMALVLGILAAAYFTFVPVKRVIIISFDGLRPGVLTELGPKGMPHFHQAIKEGASTLNARTDPAWTITMPNHTCMITGRGVSGPQGHNYKDNRSTDKSIHINKGSYVGSIFDVAKKRGRSTGFFASKLKFQTFLNSYFVNVHSVTNGDDALTLKRLIEQLRKKPPVLTFVHFAGLDSAGHHYGWGSQEYLTEAMRQDIHLGEIMDAIARNRSLSSTIVMITADHGGTDRDHDDIRLPENYRIPLIIWGKDVAVGVDLYRINSRIRKDPGEQQVPYGDALQPIRNGDVANGALHVLGLPLVPGSTIGNPGPIRVSDKDNAE